LTRWPRRRGDAREVSPSAREAAFGSTPHRIPRAAVEPDDRWLVAVALGGQGHYAAAAAVLERLAADPAVPGRIAAHAAVTRAAHLRQLGGHAAARAWDARGLRLATAALRAAGTSPDGGSAACGGSPGGRGPAGGGVTGGRRAEGRLPAGADVDDGTDAGAARIDALVGLAADAVGLGDPAGAERLLAAAAPALAAHPSWRPTTRAGWVRAELALVRGRPTEAVAPAEAALAAAGRGGSRRHLLKSRIVLAVARSVAGVMTRAAAVTELDAAAAECAGLGLLPLCWPAGLAALDLTPLPAVKPQVRINEQVASPAGTALGGRPDGTTRRRHAVRTALNVIEQRSDALGKRQMGESVWIPQPTTLM
jgi:hypothetical protein